MIMNRNSEVGQPDSCLLKATLLFVPLSLLSLDLFDGANLIFTCDAKRYLGIVVFCFISFLFFILPKNQWRPNQSNPQISNLTTDLTSEDVWMLQWPLKLSKGSMPYMQYAHGYVDNQGHWFQIHSFIHSVRHFLVDKCCFISYRQSWIRSLTNN